ncbi:glycoside hydrolase family 16 protein [Frankia sp. CIT1]|nr:glycoside hydrolase family 16 protein [Frankia sp. CIT1]
MPRGDLPGWKQIFTEDFVTDTPVGSFPSAAPYQGRWNAYPDGTLDTAGKNGAKSYYYPSKVLSVQNGVLDYNLHTANGTPMGAALIPVLPGSSTAYQGQLYGKFTIRFRADPLVGFKTAWLLWPDSGAWPRDGEIDFPEGDLSGSISAFMHRQDGTSGGDQEDFGTTTTYTAWHTASIEWTPNKVDFILDDRSIGSSTGRIPNTPMHWVIQTESSLDHFPAASTSGAVQIDWVAVYSYLQK